MTSLFQKLLKRKKLLAFILVIILVLGFYIKNKYSSNAKVESTKIEKGVVSNELILSGEIKADEYAKLAFQGGGELSKVEVKEGDNVKKGQILARLNTNSLYQQLQSSQADLRYYQTVLDRVYDQLKGHENDESFTQRETRTAAEAAKDKAYRANQVATQNLENNSLKAPFEGTVASITYPFTGINTTPAIPEIEVVNPKTLYFDVSADQTEVTDLKNDQKVNIILDSYPDEKLEGNITYIGLTPKADEISTVYKVRVNFQQANFDFTKFRIGMTGDAKIILSAKSEALNVPLKFVKSDVKGKYLRVGNKNNKTYIETGIEGEDKIEVNGDQIKEGDTVYD